jgi:hypothetical protein
MCYLKLNATRKFLRNVIKNLSENLKKRYYMGDLGVDGNETSGCIKGGEFIEKLSH